MSKHLKRLAAPRTIRLHRKEKTWTIKPSPGPHPLEKSISLGLIIRDYLKLCDSLKEAKRIIFNEEILVDNHIRKNYKFPCGFMDIISIPKKKKYYRIIYDKAGKLTLTPISSKETEWKLCRCTNALNLVTKTIPENLTHGLYTLDYAARNSWRGRCGHQ